MFLLKLFGSKKLIAAVTGVVALVLVPVLNSKLGLHLDPIALGGSLAGIVGVVFAYIAAQYKIDISSGGETTTSALLARIADAKNGPVPPSVLVALKFAAELLPAGAGKDAVHAALFDLEDLKEPLP